MCRDASSTVSGSAKALELVPIRTNANNTAGHNPTGSLLERQADHHDFDFA
jgi:hypothetical protein